MIFFRNLPLMTLVALAVIGGGLAIFLYRPERRRLSASRGRLLTTLRGVLILFALAALADPVLRTERSTAIEPELLVVVDGSHSFFLTDSHRSEAEVKAEALALGVGATELESFRGATRVERAARALEGGLGILRKRYHVQLRALAGELYRLEDSVTGPPHAYDGATDLGRPLVEAVLARPSETLSAVLLFSDGNHHGASDPRRAATFLGRLGVPIVAVGVGAREAPRDLALTAIDATGYVFPGDEVRAQVTVRSLGFGSLEVPLEVLDGETVVAQTPVPIAAGARAQVVEVRFTVEAAGSHTFQLRLPPQPGEVSIANNARALRIDVLKGRARVLLVDRKPRWQWRYLRDAWRREENVSVDAFLLGGSLSRVLPKGFPVTRDDLLGYDVVVLGDVAPVRLPSEWQTTLREFVFARGGTLVVLAGDGATPARWEGSILEELLPVELLSPAPDPRLGSEVARGGLALSLTALGETSALTRLVAGRERNARLWEMLPRPQWLAPVASVRPGASVLAAVAPVDAVRLPGFRPPAPGLSAGESAEFLEAFAQERGAVFVTRPAGAGRVLYAGIDSTWRWRFRFGNELHDRFWGQVVRWALSEGFRAEDAYVRVGTDAHLYSAPATVRIRAWIRDTGNGLDTGNVTALVQGYTGRQGEGGTTPLEPLRLPLNAVAGSGGRFEGELRLGADMASAERQREYTLRLEIPDLPGYAELLEPATATFAVEARADPERLDWQCDQETLTAMARLSGGAYFPLDRWQEALTSLPRRESERLRLVERSLWDYPFAVSFVLLGLLLAEWIVRKRSNLI